MTYARQRWIIWSDWPKARLVFREHWSTSFQKVWPITLKIREDTESWCSRKTYMLIRVMSVRLLSFYFGGVKIRVFLVKIEHASRKLLYFVNRPNASYWKSAKLVMSFKNYGIKNINLGDHYLMKLFFFLKPIFRHFIF